MHPSSIPRPLILALAWFVGCWTIKSNNGSSELGWISYLLATSDDWSEPPGSVGSMYSSAPPWEILRIIEDGGHGVKSLVSVTG